MDGTLPNVLCCMCSAVMQSNPTNMCMNCIRASVDITQGISSSLQVHHCRGCQRWLGPPWMDAELESRELLTLCLKKITGLTSNRAKLVDASWVWTEPHSKRLKVKLTVQMEVVQKAVLQQSLLVEFAVRNQQCPDCQASYAQGMWTALVQVRQRVQHKRTFFFLEQMLLKHNAHSDCLSIEAFKDGMDFYFMERNQAVRFTEFLASTVPVKSKHSKKLTGADLKSNLYTFKYSYMVEIVPVCKDDLCILPRSLARTLGDMSMLCLTQRVGAAIHLVDPSTCQLAELSAERYWNNEFIPIAHTKQLIPFVILSVEPLTIPDRASARKKGQSRKMQLSECTVAREVDLGANDTQFITHSHLGHILKAGDVCLGYDLSAVNLEGENEILQGLNRALPDVVLVRKHYEKERMWKLREMELDGRQDLTQREVFDAQADYEVFLQQLEADKEMRKNVLLYRNSSAVQRMTIADEAKEGEEVAAPTVDIDDEEVGLDELLEDLTLSDRHLAPELTDEDTALLPHDQSAFHSQEEKGEPFEFTADATNAGPYRFV